MKDALGAGDRPLDLCEIAEIALDHLDALQGVDILPAAGREVVEYPHPIAAARERLGHVRTDETGAAGHDVDLACRSHGRTVRKPPPRIKRTARGRICRPGTPVLRAVGVRRPVGPPSALAPSRVAWLAITLALPVPFAGADISVPLRIVESMGVARQAAPVTVGVPLPRGAVRDPSSLWVSDPGGVGAPSQAAVLERWPDASVRWMLLDLPVTVAASAEAVFTLRQGKPPQASATPRVRIEHVPDGLLVDTGVLRFTVPATGNALANGLVAERAARARSDSCPRSSSMAKPAGRRAPKLRAWRPRARSGPRSSCVGAGRTERCTRPGSPRLRVSRCSGCATR